MPRTTLSAGDQQAMLETLYAYAWALDRGDLDGVVETFAPDGTVVRNFGDAPEPQDGEAAIRAYYAAAMRHPSFRGGQHHIQPLHFEDTADGHVLHSYFQYLHTVAGEPPRVVNLGYYRDTFVQHGGEWRFKEKVIGPWRSDRPEVHRSSQPANA